MCLEMALGSRIPDREPPAGVAGTRQRPEPRVVARTFGWRASLQLPRPIGGSAVGVEG